MNTLRIAGGEVLRPDGTVESADVLIDTEGGEIVAVGRDVDAGDETLQAEGGFVIPGLVNAHTHVAMTLLRGFADDKPLDAWLQEDIWPVEAELTPEDVRVGAELGVLEMIKSGTTAFADMYFEVEKIAEAVDTGGLKALLGYTALTVGKDDDAASADVDRSIQVAEALDGAADGRIRTNVQPHSLTTVGEEYLREIAGAAREHDFPLHVHANETTNEVDPIVDREGQRPIDWAEDLDLLQDGTLLAHGTHLNDEEIALLADRDVTVAHNPAANAKLASGIAPVQKMLDAGVRVALGTDGPASNNVLDLVQAMRDAALVGKIADEYDAAAVSAETVVEMATRNGAVALGFEDAGRVEPGAAADIAVVDMEKPHLTPRHELVSHLVYAATGSDVRHTVCDGQLLMRDREVVTMDEADVRERAEQRAFDLVERAT
ncbi:MAG: 5-methylthioadenosine/S-adenosylhomocysteine deaminase [Halobacteriales archaeon]|jgi:5-methylthioadenosine/S-adenosylhomocysteine deaminase